MSVFVDATKAKELAESLRKLDQELFEAAEQLTTISNSIKEDSEEYFHKQLDYGRHVRRVSAFVDTRARHLDKIAEGLEWLADKSVMTENKVLRELKTKPRS